MCLPPKLSPVIIKKVIEPAKNVEYVRKNNEHKPDIFKQMFIIQQYKCERDKIHEEELLQVKKELSASLSREKALNEKVDIMLLLLTKNQQASIKTKSQRITVF